MPDFELGKPYFFVVYQDRDLTVPVIDTLYFKEATTTDDGKTGYIFKKLIAFSENAEEVFFGSEAASDGILDFDALLVELRAARSGTLATDPASGRKSVSG